MSKNNMLLMLDARVAAAASCASAVCARQIEWHTIGQNGAETFIHRFGIESVIIFSFSQNGQEPCVILLLFFTSGTNGLDSPAIHRLCLSHFVTGFRPLRLATIFK
jgi:hypothetical protein